jgi:hypothetical protein
VRAAPRRCELYPGICLTSELNARKNLCYGSRKVPQHPSGSSLVHIYTQTVHKPRNKTEYTARNIHNNNNTKANNNTYFHSCKFATEFGGLM